MWKNVLSKSVSSPELNSKSSKPHARKTRPQDFKIRAQIPDFSLEKMDEIVEELKTETETPRQWVSTAHFDEIRCLTCSCIESVTLRKETEQILKCACYKSSFHCFLPYKKKRDSEYHRAKPGADLKQCLGSNNSRSVNALNTPPYQRKIAVEPSSTAVPNWNIGNNLTVPRPVLSGVVTKEGQVDSTAEQLAGSPNKAFTGDRSAIVCHKDLTCQQHNGIYNTSFVRDSLYSSFRPYADIGLEARIAAAKMKSNSGKKPVRVHLLTGDSVLLVFEAKATVKEVFEQICSMHQIKESKFFGLTTFIEKEHRFLDLRQRLSKYAPKEWGKDLKRRGSDLSVQPTSVFTLQFQVQYYVEHPKLICDQQSRHHYYLQLKRNVLQSKVTTQDEVIFTLAAIALHLDFGTFDPLSHQGHYFNPRDYAPSWFLEHWNETYLWEHLPKKHSEFSQTSIFNAQAEYIRDASCIDDVPVHYYKLFKTKKEVEPSVLLCIYHMGIRIHHISQHKNATSNILNLEFPWSKVGQLLFVARRFEIYPEDQPASRKLTYYTGSHARSKYLLRLLRDTHSQYLSLTPFVPKQTKRQYRESYISGKNLDYDREIERLSGCHDIAVSPASNKSKEERSKVYKSYNSSTSHGSSHTSGIETDIKPRQYDDDDEEDSNDNAFVDDFDPIEHDSPSSEVIFITQEHLEAPAHKNLSVNDLTTLENNDLETASATETCNSGQTLNSEAATLVRDAADVTPDDVIESPFPKTPAPMQLDTGKVESKTADIVETQKSTGFFSGDGGDIHPDLSAIEADSATPLENEMTSSSYTSYPNAYPNFSLSRESSDKFANKGASPNLSNGDQLLPTYEQHLASVELFQGARQGSGTYYDDTHTIPRQHRSSGETQNGRRHSHDPLDHKQKVKSVKSCKDQRKTSDHEASNEFLPKKVNEKRHRRSKSKVEGSNERHHKRHHRHKSLHDASGMPSVEAGDPSGAHFGQVLSANKSYDDLLTPLSRSSHHKDIPSAFVGQAPPSDRYSSHTMPTRGCAADHDVQHQRKMSDACQKTIAAQHRRLSDGKSNKRPESPRAPQNKQLGGPGCTPHKPLGHKSFTPHKAEVLLRTKHEKMENNKRPISYHAGMNGYSTKQSPKTCYNTAILTSRPAAYIESFKEVIV